jgi:hypothetical protein
MIFSSVIVEKDDASSISNVPITLPITREFDKNNIIGKADIYFKDGVLMANLDIDGAIHKDLVKELYPSIGGTILNTFDKKGQMRILGFSLSNNKNVDETILQLKEYG